MIRKKIAILRGGPSSEYEVSLKTGRSVLDELSGDMELVDVVVDKQGNWFAEGLQKTPKDSLFGVEAVFNAMHGEYGEDGKVQQLLDQLHVPYTGAQALAAALSMNKEKSKEIYNQHGIKTPISKVLSKPETEEGLDFQAMLVFRNFTMPVVLKPVGMGSSIGVSIAKTFEDLKRTMKILYEYGPKVLIEEYIYGKEATVGVIENMRGEKNYSLSPVEIRKPKQNELFDYESKYDSSKNCPTDKICPGCFSIEESRALQDMAIRSHEALGLRHYSRSDFIISPRRGVYILETNSLPGLSKESLFPIALEAHDIKYKDFLLHILGLL